MYEKIKMIRDFFFFFNEIDKDMIEWQMNKLFVIAIAEHNES